MTATFNPDKVLLSQKTDGTFLDNQEVEILQGIRSNSVDLNLK